MKRTETDEHTPQVHGAEEPTSFKHICYPNQSIISTISISMKQKNPHGDPDNTQKNHRNLHEKTTKQETSCQLTSKIQWKVTKTKII